MVDRVLEAILIVGGIFGAGLMAGVEIGRRQKRWQQTVPFIRRRL